MIKLQKGEEPEVLARNAERWTEVVLGKISAGQAPTKSERNRYNHADIKRALVAETHGKCAYCESKLKHISHGDIEHVAPKSRNPTRWFSWLNLTLACDVCNTNKSEAPVDEEVFIDPYEVDPEDHFWQVGSMVWARPGCDAAALTERLLDLNRADLVEKRCERIAGLMKMLESIERCESGDLKRLLWEELAAETGADREYAALSRTIVQLAKERLGRA